MIQHEIKWFAFTRSQEGVKPWKKILLLHVGRKIATETIVLEEFVLEEFFGTRTNAKIVLLHDYTTT